MTVSSIIQHRSDCYFAKLEEDYIAICSQGKQYPHCKALILAILEHWMNDKKTKGRDCYVYMTYPQWCDAMFGLYRRSTIISCLTELVEEGFIKKRPCRYAGKDSYEYILDLEIVQQQINDLPGKVGKTIHPSINAFKFKRVQKQTGMQEDDTPPATHSNLNASPPEGVYFYTGDAFKSKHTIDSVPEIPSTIDSSSAPAEQITEEISVATLPLRDEEGELFFSYSDEPPDNQWLWEEKEDEVDIFAEDPDPTEKRPVVNKSKGGDLAPGDGEKAYSAAIESDERREGSGPMPAVKKPPTPPGQPPASPGRAAPLREHPTAQSTRSNVPRQPTSEKSTGEPPSSENTLPSPTLTNGKGTSKKGELPLLCKTDTIRKLIDANRGFSLEQDGPIKNQGKILKAWCQHHPLEHYHIVMNHLKTCRCEKHKWWRERERWRWLKAENLAALTPDILAELGMTEKPQPPPGVPMPVPVSRGSSASYAPVMAARPR